MHLKVANDSDAAKLSDSMKSNNWIVLYYANWCGHCQMMKPEWNKAASMLANDDNVNVGEIESEYIPKMTTSPNVVGFPTIRIYKNGGEGQDYEGGRVADEIVEFARTKCGSNSNKSSHKHHKKTHHKKTHQNGGSRKMNKDKKHKTHNKSKSKSKSKRNNKTKKNNRK